MRAFASAERNVLRFQRLLFWGRVLHPHEGATTPRPVFHKRRIRTLWIMLGVGGLVLLVVLEHRELPLRARGGGQ
jgi:hypothetical protein